MQNITCERNIRRNAYGRIVNRTCGNMATYTQEDGLYLCEYHFKKWFKKKYGVEFKNAF